MTILSHIYPNLTAWQQNHAYSVGDRISNDTAPVKAYRCITAGTSQNLAAQGPKGTAADITDGTAHFTYISGVDYTDLNTWFSAITSPLTDNVVASIGYCGAPITIGTPSLSYLTAGTKSTGSFTITLTAAPGDSFRDKSASGALAIRTDCVLFKTSAVAAGFVNYFDISCTNVIFDGLQFQDPYSASSSTLLSYASGATGAVVSNCIFDGYSQSAVSADMVDFGGNGPLLYNTLLIDRGPTTDGAWTVKMLSTVATYKIVNCTFVSTAASSSGTAVLTDASGSTGSVKNTVVVGYVTTPFGNGGTGTLTFTNCAFDLSSSFISGTIVNGGSSLFSITDANLFNSITTDFRLKLGSPLIGAGQIDATDIPSQDDIFRTRRITWDIGADQYIPPSVMQVPTLRCVITASQASANTWSALTLIVSTLRAVATGQQVSSTTGATIYVSGITCVANALNTTSTSGSANIALTAVITAKVEVFAATSINPWSGAFSTAFGPPAVLLGTMSATGTSGTSNGSSATIQLPTPQAVSSMGQADLAAALVTIATLQSSSIGPITGIGTLQIKLSATAVIANAAGAIGLFGNLTATGTATSATRAVGISTITFGATTGVRVVFGAGTINLAATIVARQEDRFAALTYLTGVVAVTNIGQSDLVSGTNLLMAVSAAMVAVQSNLVSTANTVLTGVTAAITAGNALVTGAANTITVTAAGQFVQAQSTTATIRVPTLTAAIVAIEEDRATSTTTIAAPTTVAVAGQERLLGASTITITTLRLTSTIGLDGSVTALVPPLRISAVITSGQSDLTAATSTILPLTASGVVGFSDQAHGALTLAISANVQATTAAIWSGTETVHLAAVITATNPLAVTGSGVLSIRAASAFGQEGLATTATLISSLFDYGLATQTQPPSTALVTFATVSSSVTAALAISTTATITLPALTVVATALRGWTGTLQATLPTPTASATAMETYNAAQLSNIPGLVVTATSSSEIPASAVNTIALTVKATGVSGNIVAGLATIPTVQAAATVIDSYNVMGNSYIPHLLATGTLAQFLQVTGTSTIHLSVKSLIVPTPPLDVDAEDIIYFEADDRVVYVTE